MTNRQATRNALKKDVLNDTVINLLPRIIRAMIRHRNT